MTCLVFYDKVGATLDAEENDYYQFIIDIAQGNLNGIQEKDDQDEFLYEIAKWLRAHKTVYLTSFGDVKVSDFIKNCESLGATIKKANGYLISANNDSVRIAKSTRKFEAAVAKRYLVKLGLTERSSGFKFDEFLSGGYTDNNSFKKIVPLLRRLAVA